MEKSYYYEIEDFSFVLQSMVHLLWEKSYIKYLKVIIDVDKT